MNAQRKLRRQITRAKQSVAPKLNRGQIRHIISDLPKRRALSGLVRGGGSAVQCSCGEGARLLQHSQLPLHHRPSLSCSTGENDTKTTIAARQEGSLFRDGAKGCEEGPRQRRNWRAWTLGDGGGKEAARHQVCG